MNFKSNFTVLIHDQSATVLDKSGNTLLTLSIVELRNASDHARAFRQIIFSKCLIQFILTSATSSVQCSEVPFLDLPERKAVYARLVKPTDSSGPLCSAFTMDVDPLAEGGHVLWIASVPRDELDPWLTLIQEAGAVPVAVIPWQRALLEAAQQAHPSALYLTLEPGLARVLFVRGRNLRFTRTFPLPPDLDLLHLHDADAEAFRRAIGEELSLVLQFIQQKHRGVAPSALFTLGLPASPVPVLAPVAENLGLTLTNLATDLTAFLIEGAERESQRKGRLDLLPEEIRKARSMATYRILARAGTAAMLLLCGAATVLVRHQVQVLEREAALAETGAQDRQRMAKEGEEASRLRFGLLRVRQAEERQRQATEHLESLGVRILRTPPGVLLQHVEITQASGADLTHAFKVEGSAITRSEFSVGALVNYLDQLGAQPGLKLEPIQDVAVADSSGTAGAAGGGPQEQAQTRFKLKGTAP